MRLLVALACLAALHLASCRSHTATEDCPPSFKCHSYRLLSQHGDYEVRKYDDTLWVAWEEHRGITSMSDYPFLVEFADSKLSQYFLGQNYAGDALQTTMPLRIDLQLLNLRKPRRVSYPVRVGDKDPIPAPLHPFFIKKEEGGFIYAKKVSTKLTYKQLLHEIAKFMVKLTMDKDPFDPDRVSVALYHYPARQTRVDARMAPFESNQLPEETEEEDDSHNEIWIHRREHEPRKGGREREFAYSGNYKLGGGLNGGDSAPSGVAAVKTVGFSGEYKPGSNGYSTGSGVSNRAYGNDRSRTVRAGSELDGTIVGHMPPQ